MSPPFCLNLHNDSGLYRLSVLDRSNFVVRPLCEHCTNVLTVGSVEERAAFERFNGRIFFSVFSKNLFGVSLANKGYWLSVRILKSSIIERSLTESVKA